MKNTLLESALTATNKNGLILSDKKTSAEVKELAELLLNNNFISFTHKRILYIINDSTDGGYIIMFIKNRFKNTS